MTRLTRITRPEPPPARARPIVSSNSSQRRSGTRTRAAPMRARRRNSSTGLRRRASSNSRRSRAFMSPPISSNCSARDRLRPRSFASRHEVTCSTGWLRPDVADQSSRRRARAAPHRAARQDAGARPRRGAPAHRRYRHDDRDWLARPSADRIDGLFLRAHRRGDQHARRGRVSRRTADYGSACTRRAESSTPFRTTTTSNLILHEYIDGAGLASDPKALLFQTYSRSTGRLTGNPLPQANAYAMIQRPAGRPRSRPRSATTRFGRRASPRTSRTAGRLRGLRRWRTMPAPTRQLYDRRAEEVTLDEVERILV